MRAIVSSIFSGTLSIVVRLRGTMGPSEIDFAPSMISKGSSIHVLTGTKGEMVKINQNGELLETAVTPFPAPVIDGVILGEIWIGIWLDIEFRQARMAAMPIEMEWKDGSSREDLRASINSLGGKEVIPSNSLWHRVLDSQPMKIGKSGKMTGKARLPSNLGLRPLGLAQGTSVQATPTRST